MDPAPFHLDRVLRETRERVHQALSGADIVLPSVDRARHNVVIEFPLADGPAAERDVPSIAGRGANRGEGEGLHERAEKAGARTDIGIEEHDDIVRGRPPREPPEESKGLAAEAKESIACSFDSWTTLIAMAGGLLGAPGWLDPALSLLMVPWFLREGLTHARGRVHAHGA